MRGAEFDAAPGLVAQDSVGDAAKSSAREMSSSSPPPSAMRVPCGAKGCNQMLEVHVDVGTGAECFKVRCPRCGSDLKITVRRAKDDMAARLPMLDDTGLLVPTAGLGTAESSRASQCTPSRKQQTLSSIEQEITRIALEEGGISVPDIMPLCAHACLHDCMRAPFCS